MKENSYETFCRFSIYPENFFIHSLDAFDGNEIFFDVCYKIINLNLVNNF